MAGGGDQYPVLGRDAGGGHPATKPPPPPAPGKNFSQRPNRPTARLGEKMTSKQENTLLGLPSSSDTGPGGGGAAVGARKRHSEWVDLGYSITSSARASSIGGTLSPSAPMTRSLCGVERLPSPKSGNFLLCHAASGDLLARTRRPEAARAAATSGFTRTRTHASASALSRDAISPAENYQTSVPAWDHQVRLVPAHDQHRKALGRLRL